MASPKGKVARGVALSDEGFVPLDWSGLSITEMERNAESLFEQMDSRRTTRHFSTKDVPRKLIELALSLIHI